MGDQRYTIKVNTPPEDEPVSLEEAKLQCRIDSTGDEDYDALIDNQLSSMIKAAREHVEMLTRRTLMATVFDMYLDRFPTPYDQKNPFVFRKQWPYQIPLPRLPLLLGEGNELSIEYYDENNSLQQLTEGEDYEVDDTAEPPIVDVITGEVWPQTRERFKAVHIKFSAGYASVDDVPARAKMAILHIVGQTWMQREAIVVGSIVTDVKFLDRLLAGLTVLEF